MNLHAHNVTDDSIFGDLYANIVGVLIFLIVILLLYAQDSTRQVQELQSQLGPEQEQTASVPTPMLPEVKIAGSDTLEASWLNGEPLPFPEILRSLEARQTSEIRFIPAPTLSWQCISQLKERLSSAGITKYRDVLASQRE